MSTETVAEKLEKQPPIIKAAYKVLRSAMKQLINGECKEEEVSVILARLSPENNGYYNPDDYVSFNEAMEILGFGNNRMDCQKMLKKAGIQLEMFKNHKIGYNKHKLYALKNTMFEEYAKRRAKQHAANLRKRRKEKIKLSIDY